MYNTSYKITIRQILVMHDLEEKAMGAMPKYYNAATLWI